jgi:hypothetical protein
MTETHLVTLNPELVGQVQPAARRAGVTLRIYAKKDK